MSRREIYRRTKGYSIFGVVNAKMFSAAVILVVIALGLKNPQLILDSDILCVFGLCGAVALFWILRYWKHLCVSYDIMLVKIPITTNARR